MAAAEPTADAASHALPEAGDPAPAAAPNPPVTSASPIDRAGAPARKLHVTIVAANPFEFDSRFLRSGTSLAEDGHTVTILGWSGPGLPREEELAPGVKLIRLDVDRRISTVLRPLPSSVRRALSRLAGLDPDATVLPPDRPRGWDRLRHPIRRVMELAANARRVGPWTDLVVKEAPQTDVFHCQSFIVLPVARGAAKRLSARFVYDVADYHSEAARLARMPWMFRELVRRRERSWIRDAAGFLAVSDPVADLLVRRWKASPRPGIVLNCPPAWRPDEPAAPISSRLHEAAGISPERPIVLYQGGFSVDRGVEELVAAIDQHALRELDAAAVFMGYGRLQGFLEDAARRHPDRVYVLPAVPPDDLLSWTAGADVSFVGQPPRTLNQKMNLPNKLFESIMAGAPVVVSTGNEQCRLVTAEGIGRCADIDDPAAVARAVATLMRAPIAERRALRDHCRAVALARYTWDGTAGDLVALYRRLAAAG
ncbi:MAG: glycosyltransferase [Chloroflexota bacterium]